MQSCTQSSHRHLWAWQLDRALTAGLSLAERHSRHGPCFLVERPRPGPHSHGGPAAHRAWFLSTGPPTLSAGGGGGQGGRRRRGSAQARSPCSGVCPEGRTLAGKEVGPSQGPGVCALRGVPWCACIWPLPTCPSPVPRAVRPSLSLLCAELQDSEEPVKKRSRLEKGIYMGLQASSAVSSRRGSGCGVAGSRQQVTNGPPANTRLGSGAQVNAPRPGSVRSLTQRWPLNLQGGSGWLCSMTPTPCPAHTSRRGTQGVWETLWE